MSNIKQQQQETVASIDTAKALVDKVISIMGLLSTSPSLTVSFSTNPIGFLLQLLRHLGITYDELKKWLTDFLVYVVPVLEVSVKSILLTNLKTMVSCSIDPRIPAKYRKMHKGFNDDGTSQENGIDIDIESIDYLDKLSVNPLSDLGKTLYFGLENIENSYKFARAVDYDAFLWFVIHKGKFPNASMLDINQDIASQLKTYGSTPTLTPSDGTLLSELTINYQTDSPSSILLGNTFAYKDGHVVSMCIDRSYDENNNIINNTIVPVSDDWNTANWYKSINIEQSIGTKDLSNSRNYNKERAICNIQYIDQSSSSSPLTGLVNHKFKFTILPKPVIHIPNITQGEPPWRFTKLLFNDKGEFDVNGKYTLYGEMDSTNSAYCGNAVTIDYKSGSVTVNDKKKVIENLIECYPGLTIYEFNYDYVMSIRLFDAKTLTTTLLNSLFNTQIGVGISANYTNQDGTETVKQIIKNIIETDDSELNNCFYTFDNTKYDSLLRKAEEKRARQERFGDVTNEIPSLSSVTATLIEYDTTAELHQQIDILGRAITEASVIVSEGTDAVNQYNVQYNFLFNLIEQLVLAIVESVLSPKVIMLLMVNQKMMGSTWQAFTMADLLKAMQSIIVSIIKEIRDLIIQELLKLVLKQLSPIVETMNDLILKEQIDNYTSVITEIIRNCPTLWFNLGNSYEDTTLDTVDYADIDTSVNNNQDTPTTNNC